MESAPSIITREKRSCSSTDGSGAGGGAVAGSLAQQASDWNRVRRVSHASMHEDDEIEAVVRAAAGRLILLYLPTYSPWLNPIEMLWRHFRRHVTHCEFFATKQALVAAAQDCFDRFNQYPWKILSVIGSNAANIV